MATLIYSATRYTSKKFVQIRKFYEHKQFIIDDGGETREDEAFEKDGDTIRQGWLNFYYK
ncbi:MAG: hypothetical protein NTW50_00510 [Candidatus Berkelbacteria bacterium]|nr:hypothetical protein [Candidatus Berkelbacteria bacterium]